MKEPGKDPIKVLIVDDHPFFRQGVKLFLNSLDNIEIIDEAENGDQAVEKLAVLDVDVILMDFDMPGKDGISMTEILLGETPELRIMILTSYGNDDKIHDALRAGAAGYCLKDAPPEELATAIKAVYEGGTYLGRGIFPKALTNQSQRQNNVNIGEKGDLAANSIFDELTKREIDVLRLLAKGHGNREIAQDLVVSEKTVKTHVANILDKLDVKTRTQAALLASKYFPEETEGSDLK